MLYLDGSFVTDKETVYGAPPGDFDGCWDPVGVDPMLLDPVLLDFTNKRAAQKAKFGGELFLSTAPASSIGPVFLDFFQVDKITGAAKGILGLDLLQLHESELDETSLIEQSSVVKPSTEEWESIQDQPVTLRFDPQPLQSQQGYRP